jgi:hypothetical protein
MERCRSPEIPLASLKSPPRFFKRVNGLPGGAVFLREGKTEFVAGDSWLVFERIK